MRTNNAQMRHVDSLLAFFFYKWHAFHAVPIVWELLLYLLLKS
jgi:hypothetical protein